MFKTNSVLFKQSILALCILAAGLGSQLAVTARSAGSDPLEAAASGDDSIAPTAGPETASDELSNRTDKKKSLKLEGKAEVTEVRDNTLHALEGSRMYQRGVLCLSTKRFGVAADCFKSAGDQFAFSAGNEKYMAQSRFAEAQSRRILGQKQAATKLYQEAVDLFRQYDPLSPYLKAALDNLGQSTLSGHASLTQARLKALTTASGIQTVERDVYLKGSATDIDSGVQWRSGKGTGDVKIATIKKTVLQAFVKMTCLETAELGSNYYTAADRYFPLKANGKTVVLSATSGFLVPVIRIRLNGRFYNVGVDLPELSSSRRTVYLVTDGRNVLAIDPANYDVWKLYANFKRQDADFEWKKLTHIKNLPPRIVPN
jgi:hypothetical protein